MTNKIDPTLPTPGTGPTVPPSPGEDVAAAFPSGAADVAGLAAQGKELAGLDPNSFKGFKIITDSSGKEWVVS